MSRMSVDGAACQSRRERLTDALNKQGLTGALLLRPQHLAYFFGLSGWRSQPAAGLIASDGSNVLALGASTDCLHVAENVVRFEDSYFKTTIEDRERLAIAAVSGNLRSVGIMGVDVGISLDIETRPLTGIIAEMRRRKDQDEIAVISRAVAATEAGLRVSAKSGQSFR